MSDIGGFIEGILSLMDTMDSDGIGISAYIPDCQKSTRELLSSELTMFAMNLSYSDGRISRDEKKFINENLGCDFTYDEIVEIIKENRIDSDDFLSRVPLSVQLAVEVDNSHPGDAGNADLSIVLYKVFAVLGGRIVSCDSNVTEEELRSVTVYLTTIKNYINENIDTEIRKITTNPVDDAKMFFLEGSRAAFDTSAVSRIISETAKQREEEEKEWDRKFAEVSQPKLAPWDAHYFDYPCPYCGAKKVRYSKWEDKRMSTAFWGFWSYELHCRFKCDNCKKMWN